MPAAPAVTVVIPTRNRRELLLRTLSTALAQQAVELEIVVVADGSEDDTVEQLRRVADPRLVVLAHETSKGMAGARNAGIDAARGNWLAFLDDDDLWAPTKLARQIAAADAAAAAGFVYSAALHVGPELAVRHLEPAPEPHRAIRALRFFNPIPAGASNVLARTELVRAVGGFDESLKQLADWDMWLRLTQSVRPAACPEPLVAYVQHGGTQRRVLPSVIAREHRVLVAKHGLQASAPEAIWFWRWVAGGHLAADRRGRAALELARAALRFRSPPDLRQAARLLAGRAPQPDAAAQRPPAPDWLRALAERSAG